MKRIFKGRYPIGRIPDPLTSSIDSAEPGRERSLPLVAQP